MSIAPIPRITDDQLAGLADRHGIPTEAMQVIRHIACLYSGGAIEGDPTQLFTTGHYVWLARRALEQMVALSQQPAPAAVPDGWRQVIDEVRERMNNETPSAYDNEGCRSYAGHILDCVIDELDALSCTPAAPAPEAQKPAAWEVSSFGGRVDRIVVREDVAQELASNLIQRDAKDVRVRPLYTAPPAAEQPDSARSILTDEDMRQLRRFQEICEDSDAGGHDLPKEAVKRLERAGVLRSCGFGRHEVTLFGDYLLGKESDT